MTRAISIYETSSDNGIIQYSFNDQLPCEALKLTPGIKLHHMHPIEKKKVTNRKKIVNSIKDQNAGR